MKKVAAVVAVLCVLAAAFIFAPGSDFWSTTKYCPWTHRVGYGPQVCKVKDRLDNRFLVEHANLSTNQLQLSITQNGKTMWIQHPDGKVKEFSNALDQNQILFDRQDDKFLVVNGQRFPITVLSRN